MEQGTEKSETELEILIKSIEGKVEETLSKFSDEKIASCSGKIKPLKTMLEFRNDRDNFLKKIETHKQYSPTKFYFEEEIKKVNEDDFKDVSSNKSIKGYFEREIKRAESIRARLIENCSNINTISLVCGEFSTLLQSLSQHIAKCNDIINELSASSIASYTLDDILLLIKGQFVRHQKVIFINTILDEVNRIAISKRENILSGCFSLIEKDLAVKNKQTVPEIPFLTAEVSELDEKLVKIAKSFDVSEKLEEHNSQQFLYHCDRKFTDVWTTLDAFTIKKIQNPKHLQNPEKSAQEYCDEAFISNVTVEEDINNVWNFMISNEFDKTISILKEESSNYNHIVNGYDYKTNTVLKRRKPLQKDKIQMFTKMRIARAKYLILMIFTHINQFEAMKANLFGSHFKWTESKEMKHLIDVLDENGQKIYFDTTEKEFLKIKDCILHVISYYVTDYNTKTVEIHQKDTKIIDKIQMVCDMLEQELCFVNAKRNLVQSLYECACQDKDETVVETILKVIARRPILHINSYHTARFGYNLSLKKIEQQALVIQALIKLQVFHERRISAGLDKSVPLFDRIIDAPNKKALFAESVPISPLEHFSLRKIPRLINAIDEMANELAEETDIQKLKFMDYVELSYWKVFGERFFKLSQAMSYTIHTYPFINELSSQAQSLISSPIFSSLTNCLSFINEIPEPKRLRFSLNFLVFMNICWMMQQKLIQSDVLQDVYISQSSRCGFNEPKVYMQNFKKFIRDEMIDINDSFTSERILEIANIDYESFDFDFSSKLQLRRHIINGNFTMIKEMYSFQKMHNYILDIAVRYNQFVLDNDFIVDHFGLAIDESSDFFLTAADNINQQDGNFVRSFMASDILFDSQYILDNYKKSQEDRVMYFVNIRQTKAEVRLILNAQAKQREVTYQNYITEMVETFSAAAYRLELAFVCRITRQVLLMNSFCDAFLLEPTSILLVTESGRAQNHYVIPLWATVFRYCRSAPLQRQATVFKQVLTHIAYLYRIIQMVRFECSLPQSKIDAFNDLLQSQFKMESVIPQKIFNELQRTPGGMDYDVCSIFMHDKAKLLELRMELGILESIDASFLSNESPDTHLRDQMLSLYKRMFCPNECCGMSSLRYVPKWSNMFFNEAAEATRNELGRRLVVVDKEIEVDLTQKQLHTSIESTGALSESIDYSLLMLSHINLKFAFFQLHNGIFDFSNPFEGLTLKQYFNANSIWTEQIIPAAHKLLTPKEEEASIFYLKQKAPDQNRYVSAQIDALRNECDEILLSKQIKDANDQNELIPYILSSNEDSNDTPDFQFSSPTKAIDAYFLSNVKSCKTQLVKLLSDSVISSKMKSDSDDLRINSEKLEDLMRQITVIIQNFSKDSFQEHTIMWYSLIQYLFDFHNQNNESDLILNIYAKSVKERFTDMLTSKVSSLLAPKIMKINKIERMIEERKKAIIYEDIKNEKEVRKDLEKLVSDLHHQTEIVKNKFTKTKESMYGRVQKRIKVASKLQFSVSENFSPQKQVNSEEVFKERQEEIAFLKKKIVAMRIIRCMSSIASRRFYIKRIRTNENDSKYESAKLWETKREFEIAEKSATEDLQKYYQNLADDEIEIEKTKQMIENEKQNTIQLVHWKATNQKKEVELQNRLKKYEGVGKTNIGELLVKLEKAKERLEKLKKSTEELEIIHERDIRRPMTTIEKTRKKITVTRAEQLNFSRLCTEIRTTRSDSNTKAISTIREENGKLRSRNESLRKQVEDYENAKESLPKEIRETIEEIKPSPRNDGRKVTKASILSQMKTPRKQKGITRPVTTMAVQKPAMTIQKPASAMTMQKPNSPRKKKSSALGKKKRSETSYQFI